MTGTEIRSRLSRVVALDAGVREETGLHLLVGDVNVASCRAVFGRDELGVRNLPLRYGLMHGARVKVLVVVGAFLCRHFLESMLASYLGINVFAVDARSIVDALDSRIHGLAVRELPCILVHSGCSCDAWSKEVGNFRDLNCSIQI